jgi:hypothetical protein
MVGKLLKTMKKSYLWKQFKYMLALPLLAVSLGTFAHSACSSSFLGNTDAVEEAGSSGKKEFRLIGKVVNEGKMPIPGITVWVKGTSKGTMTDGDGKFVLHVKAGDELQFSHVVYRTQNFVVKDDTPLVVKMVEYIRNMDEIVVVGCAPERGEIIEVTGRAYDFETGFSLCPAIFRADGEYLTIADAHGDSYTLNNEMFLLDTGYFVAIKRLASPHGIIVGRFLQRGGFVILGERNLDYGTKILGVKCAGQSIYLHVEAEDKTQKYLNYTIR